MNSALVTGADIRVLKGGGHRFLGNPDTALLAFYEKHSACPAWVAKNSSRIMNGLRIMIWPEKRSGVLSDCRKRRSTFVQFP